jgi:predicted O-methyltransferase YrrM
VADVLAEQEPGVRANAMAGVYMSVSPAGGRLLTLVLAARPGTVVEFGTSSGISSIYIAAALHDNLAGRLITTEFNQAKVAAARTTFAEVGLDDVITVLEGDARETLADVAAVDFLLLDGWKELCLPVLRLLESRITAGTPIVADDVDLPALAAYLDYVRAPDSGYHSVLLPIDDGMELSCRLRANKT